MGSINSSVVNISDIVIMAFFLSFLYDSFMSIGVLPTCVSVRMLEPVQLKLQTSVSCPEGAGN